MTKNKFLVLVLILIGIFMLTAQTSTATVTSTCAGREMNRDEFNLFKITQNVRFTTIKVSTVLSQPSAAYTVTNNTDCYLPMSLASYNMFDLVLENQTLFDGENLTIAPFSSATLSVWVPTCMAQIDAYFGDYELPPLQASSQDITFAYYQAPYCMIPPPPPPVLTGACAVSPNSIDVNGTINWSSTVSGGTGAYTYSWSGTDGLSGNSAAISKTYTNPGAKTGTVTITSGTQSVVRSCNAVVNQIVNPNLNVNCEANPTAVNVNGTINWSSTVSGGTGAYTYSWSGTDSLSGNSSSVSKSYSTPGTKTGTVTVTSGGQTLTRSCTVSVNQIVDPTLNASCAASPTSINVNGTINWSSTVSGGTGAYTYSWSGTDSLSGNSSSVSKSYSTPGTKTGTVTVTSGTQSVSPQCNAVVTENQNNNLTVYCDVDDSSVDVDEDVRFTANASGGTGSYSYDWNGDDGLHGYNRTVTWSYDDDGTKDATVRVTSGNESRTASCSVRVREENNDDLSVSCYANPTNPQVGQQMNWYASVSGGDGDYDYDWDGDDGLNSSSRSPSMTYNSSGRKEATVTVRDGDGNRDERTCSVNVSQNSVLAFSQVYQPPYESVYLSQVPYTGVEDNLKLVWFMLGLLAFSAYIAYIVISHKKSVGEWQ